VLYLGLIEDTRHCLDLAYVARDHAEKFRVVYHGYGETKYLDRIRCAAGEAVTLSTELVPENLLPDLVASADIGLVFYKNDCANDLLTAFSSEKVALYCRAGVPFIAFDTVSYRELVERFQCCVLIKNIREFPQAVEVILNDYSAYSINAIKAFREYYQYETNMVQVIKQLSMFDRPDL
jgi:glycosyltransferase involved in cell wall biosynthesis